MKIAIFSEQVPPVYAGGGRGAARYAQKIAKFGHDVTLFTLTNNPNKIPGVNIHTIKIPETIAKYDMMYKLVKPAWVVLHALKNINTDYDIVHCYSAFLNSTIFAMCGKIKGIPSIVETTLLDADDPVSISNQRLGLLKEALISASDKVVALSPKIEERIRISNVPTRKCVVIPNTVDAKKFSPRSYYANRIEKLNKFDKVIVSVGILKPRKNQKEILKVYRKVLSEIGNLNVGVALVGPKTKDMLNKEYTADIYKAAKKYGIQDKIILPGKQENVRKWLLESNIFMFASKNEGLPFSLLEAMSCGLPCLVKKMDTTTDYIIDHGVDGLIYKSEDHAIRYMIDLLNGDRDSKKLGNNARKKVKSKFSDKKKVMRYNEIYNELK